MRDVTVHNFEEHFESFKSEIEKCKFISIDLEFSALNQLRTLSLFDSPRKRYAKLRKNMELIIPLQVGITLFLFDGDSNEFCGKPYTFYVKPALFFHINSCFCFEASSLAFLSMYNFDFNKFAYDGIPYLNKMQEADLKLKGHENLLSETECNFPQELEVVLEREGEILKTWFNKAHIGEHLSMPNIMEKYKNSPEILFFVHKNFRSRFKYLWTTVDSTSFIVKKVSEEEFQNLERQYDYKDKIIQKVSGFLKVYKLLCDTKKPLVGHNLLLDILILINNFEGTLPETYPEFKRLTNTLFPTIFDTKHISYNLRSLIPEDKQFGYTSLNKMYKYFKDGHGKNLSANAPTIELLATDDFSLDKIDVEKFHEAGWDSFCTGFIFVYLAYLNIYQSYPVSKKFMSQELIIGLEKYKNCVNLIRGSVQHIKMDGEDPESNRPPWLVVESVKNKSINLNDATSELSQYGLVELKLMSNNSRLAIVAVDNYSSSRIILRKFKENKDFKVSKYSLLRHSSFVKFGIMGGFTISGGLLIYLTYQILKS